MELLKISLCFFPSIWPETFSFVIQELMAMKAPIVAFNIGAPSERLKNYQMSQIVNDINSKSALNSIILLNKMIIKNENK